MSPLPKGDFNTRVQQNIHHIKLNRLFSFCELIIPIHRLFQISQIYSICSIDLLLGGKKMEGLIKTIFRPTFASGT